MINIEISEKDLECDNLKINLNKYKWRREEAIMLIRSIWNGCAIYGYHVALTGSVLYDGVSNNDLDLILYPRVSPHDDYTKALHYIILTLGIIKTHSIQWKNLEHKLVFECVMTDERKINIMIPSFTFGGKLDKMESKSNFNDKSS
jgi:hypothetical protein